MTIRAWRIVQFHLADHALDGEGARLYGGRWNFVSVPMVYAASNRALALLELLVHLTPAARMKYVWISLDFDKSLMRRLDERLLPADWAAFPPANATRHLGTHWAEEKTSVVLEVPSVIVPQESNYLLNPLHPEFRRVQPGPVEPLEIDVRLQSLQPGEI